MRHGVKRALVALSIACVATALLPGLALAGGNGGGDHHGPSESASLSCDGNLTFEFKVGENKYAKMRTYSVSFNGDEVASGNVPDNGDITGTVPVTGDSGTVSGTVTVQKDHDNSETIDLGPIDVAKENCDVTFDYRIIGKMPMYRNALSVTLPAGSDERNVKAKIDRECDQLIVTFVFDKTIVAGPFFVPSKPSRTVLTIKANANDGFGWYTKTAAVAKVKGC